MLCKQHFFIDACLGSIISHSAVFLFLSRFTKTYCLQNYRIADASSLTPTWIPGVSTSGGATPMPDQTSSLTPAWDPLSRTLPYFYSYLGLPKLTAYKIYRTADASSLTPAWNAQPLASNSQIASKQPDRPQHPLLDERLVGAQLKVVGK